MTRNDIAAAIAWTVFMVALGVVVGGLVAGWT